MTDKKLKTKSYISTLLPDKEADNNLLEHVALVSTLRGDNRYQIAVDELAAQQEEAIRLMCAEHGVDFTKGTWLLELLFALAQKVYPKSGKAGRKTKWAGSSYVLIAEFADKLIASGEAKSDAEAARIIARRAKLDQHAYQPDITAAQKMSTDAIRIAIYRGRELALKINKIAKPKKKNNT